MENIIRLRTKQMSTHQLEIMGRRDNVAVAVAFVVVVVVQSSILNAIWCQLSGGFFVSNIYITKLELS